MMFRDREHAASLLLQKLIKYKPQKPLVLGIPRGAVPMAKVIADGLDGDLDVVLVHKLGAPGQPEFAIGSVDEQGRVYLSGAAAELGVSEEYLEREKEEQLETLRRRRRRYTPFRPPADPSGRVVIVVDNGIATGATMIAALRSVREHKPAKLIAAVAVLPVATLKHISKYADEVVYLDTPEDFFAVGQFFEDFSQVTDEEVIRILASTKSAEKKQKHVA
ncbi:MAG TPA: phosphoribosyltransferase family protein [candidate division Zixibacteria bacterium]|nr:phosphoribosyltransferase family protein [candidate division Zixibacteria bacterium]